MTKQKTPKRVFEDDEILVRNNDDFMFTEVDGESVTMNVNTGVYFGMNGVTTDIWHLLEEEKDYNTLIQNLIEIYDVDEKTSRKDSRLIVARMIANKLIVKKKT